MGLTPFRSLSPASLASVKHDVFFSVATENDIKIHYKEIINVMHVIFGI